MLWSSSRASLTFVFVVPGHGLPKFNLVSVRVHNPGELSILVRLWAADHCYITRLQLFKHFIQVVDPIVDHKGGVTGTEPLASSICKMPCGKTQVFGLIIRLPKYSTTKIFQCHTQVFLIPGCQRSPITPALKKDSANAGYLRHGNLLFFKPLNALRFSHPNSGTWATT